MIYCSEHPRTLYSPLSTFDPYNTLVFATFLALCYCALSFVSRLLFNSQNLTLIHC